MSADEKTKQNANDGLPGLPSKPKAEPIHTFTIPNSVRDAFKTTTDKECPKTVGFREVTANIEEMAIKRAAIKDTSASAESVVLCLAQLDGEAIDDTTAQEFVSSAPNKLRELLFSGWSSVNLPNRDEVNAFLSSKAVGF